MINNRQVSLSYPHYTDFREDMGANKIVEISMFCYIIILNYPGTLEFFSKEMSVYYTYVISEIYFIMPTLSGRK